MSDETGAAASPLPPPPPPAPKFDQHSPGVRQPPTAQPGSETAQGKGDHGPNGASATAGPSRARRLFDVGLLIATLGLGFSAITYMIDRQGQQREDERQARAELSQTVREMSGLERVYFDLVNDDDPLVAQSAYSVEISELQTLAAQAERITSAYPNIVESADLLAIGYAHFNLEDYDRAQVVLSEAEGRSVAEDDTLVATGARRALAYTYFGLGQLDEGRSTFERALSMDGFDDIPESIRVGNEIRTRQFWVNAEVAVGECVEAVNQFVQYERMAAEFYPSTQAAGGLGRSPVDTLRSLVESCQ